MKALRIWLAKRPEPQPEPLELTPQQAACARLQQMVEANRARLSSSAYKARSAAAHKGWETKRRARA